MERLQAEINQHQDIIDAQENEIKKLLEPPDMNAMGKAIRDLSNYLDDTESMHESQAKVLNEIGTLISHDWVPPKVIEPQKSIA